jgi:hypothetical protein
MIVIVPRMDFSRRPLPVRDVSVELPDGGIHTWALEYIGDLCAIDGTGFVSRSKASAPLSSGLLFSESLICA